MLAKKLKKLQDIYSSTIKSNLAQFGQGFIVGYSFKVQPGMESAYIA